MKSSRWFVNVFKSLKKQNLKKLFVVHHEFNCRYKGFNDTLPSQTAAWRSLEQQLASLMDAYGYQQIRLPIVEQTGLFKRAIGDATDIVEKEMYTF